MALIENKKNFFVGMIIIGLAVVMDQYSKHWILNYFLTHDEPERVTDFFNLVLVWNRGVSFGMFAFEDMTMQYILMGVALVVVSILLGWLMRTRSFFLSFNLSLIIGGALGNVIDRYRYGAVLDFLDFFWNDMHWPAFNVADICVSVGVFFIVIHALFDKETR